MHFASLVAIFLFMRKRIKILIKGSYLYIIKKEEKNKKEFLMIMYLIISTIPVCIIALIFNERINRFEGNLLLIGCLLIINGLILFLINDKHKTKSINFKDAFFIGVTQCLGIFPGISRSGSCLVGANLRNIKKEISTDYTFLLFIPAALGATLLKFKGIINIVSENIGLYLIVFLVTVFTTYLSLCFLLSVIRKGKTKLFSIYCIVIGVILVILKL